MQSDYDDAALAEAEAWASSHTDFVCAVFAEAMSTGRWPSPKELQRKLHKQGSDVPVYDLAEELPRQLGPAWRGIDGEISLRIRALRHCPEARATIAAAIGLLRLAYERYKTEDGTPALTAADLDTADLQRAAMVLQREQFSVLMGSADTFAADWSATINEGIAHELKELRTLEDYLVIEARFFRRKGLPAQAFRGAPPFATPGFSEPAAPAAASAEAAEASNGDPASVFVVHGRNERLRAAFFDFLKSLGLHPLEWSEAISLTGKASPYVGEVLNAAFANATAVVVLMSPDDVARLREEFHTKDDPQHETAFTGAARANVIFEAGMAIGRNERGTLLIECGRVRPFSDVGGRHVIRLDNSERRRRDVAQRLRDAGCPVHLDGENWKTAGNFELAGLNYAEPANAAPRRGSAADQPVSAVFMRSDHGGTLRVTNETSQPVTITGLELPNDLMGFRVVTHDLPIADVPPQRAVSFPVSLTMPRNKSHFSISITGRRADSSDFSVSEFISVDG